MTMMDVAAPVAIAEAAGTFEIRDAAVNVEEIMSRIRRSIEEKKKSRVFRQDPLLAQGIDLLHPAVSNASLSDRLALLRHLGG